MRLLALAMFTMMALGTPATSAAFDCLEASGPLDIVTGDHEYTRFDVTSRNGPDLTKYDARGASWRLQVYPTVRQGYPIKINGPDGGCWTGGTIIGTNDFNATWSQIYKKGNSAAIVVGNNQSTKNFTISSVRIHNAWDGVNISRLSDNFVIRDVWITHNRDDCVQNDDHRSGIVSNSLFDGCFGGFSSRNTKSSYNGRRNIWTIENNLVRLEPMPGPYDTRRMGHGLALKWEREGARLRLIENIFYVQMGAGRWYSQDSFKDLSLGIVVESRGNIIVWAGAGGYPWAVPPGFTVTTDKSVWDEAKADWLADHADMFSTSACSGNLDDQCFEPDPAP